MADLTLAEDDPAALPFRPLLPEVRRYIREHRPADWPALVALLGPLVDEPLDPLAVLPLAGCAAVGGDPRAAIPVAAAWTVLNLAVRVLDDLQDQDRPSGLWAAVGLPRAFNFAAALYTLSGALLAAAPWPAEQYRAITRCFTGQSLRLAAGQDRDLRGQTCGMEDYWRTIEEKNGAAFALACACGARCGTGDPELVTACHSFGHHLGLVLQLFDDFEGLWEPNGLGDLEAGKITLPVLYGLSVAHDRRAELRQLVDGGDVVAHAGRIRAILDGVHARDFVLWAALQERERALQALAKCPGQTGVAALEAYVTVLFTHCGQLVSGQHAGA